MGARVAVAGASGYAGGELLRLLAGHPDLEIAAVTAGSSAGRRVADLHPNLAGARRVAELTLQPHGPAALAGCDLVFLALPAGESAAVANAVPDGVKIVDLGPGLPAIRHGRLGTALLRPARRPLGHRPCRASGRPRRDPCGQPCRGARLLRDRSDARARTACRGRPGRSRLTSWSSPRPGRLAPAVRCAPTCWPVR